jgi:hypothetical protein
MESNLNILEFRLKIGRLFSQSSPGIISIFMFSIFYFITSRNDDPLDLIDDTKTILLVTICLMAFFTLFFSLVYLRHSWNKVFVIDLNNKEYHYQKGSKNIFFKDSDVLTCRHIKNGHLRPNLTINYEIFIIELQNKEIIVLTKLLGDLDLLEKKASFVVTQISSNYPIMHYLL